MSAMDTLDNNNNNDDTTTSDIPSAITIDMSTPYISRQRDPTAANKSQQQQRKSVIDDDANVVVSNSQVDVSSPPPPPPHTVEMVEEVKPTIITQRTNNISNEDKNSDTSMIQFGVDFLQSILSAQTSATATYNTNTNRIQNTREYRDVIDALKRMELVHRSQQLQSVVLSSSRVVVATTGTTPKDNHHNTDDADDDKVDRSNYGSFLQFDATDEMILRIVSYLNCRTLVQMTLTCTRLYTLAKQYAIHRTTTIDTTNSSNRSNTQRQQQHQEQQQSYRCRFRRQLSSPFELLQAYENILGIQELELDHKRQHQQQALVTYTTSTTTGTRFHSQPQYHHHHLNTENVIINHVPIPILLPSQPIRITHCGDVDYNGIYYCTGCNGNGYVFTKPRKTTSDRQDRVSGSSNSSSKNQYSVHSGMGYMDVAESDDIEISGQPLRCIIARRFSNEDILWYMSKEVRTSEIDDDNANNNTTPTMTGVDYFVDDTIVDDDNNENAIHAVSTTRIKQIYSFWAPLMQIDETTNTNNKNNSAKLFLHYPNFTAAATTSVQPQQEQQWIQTQHPNHIHGQMQQNGSNNIDTITAWQSLSPATNADFVPVNRPPVVELI